MNKQNVIKVPIMGQDYVVNTTASEKYIQDIASFVNNKMIEIQDSGIEKESQLRIAVLGAMNIADELFTQRKSQDNIIKKLDKKAEKLSSMVEKEIQMISD